MTSRLTNDSLASLWDRIEKLNLKTFSTCLKKTSIGVGNKVVKLHEDQQLLAWFLVIQQSRLQLVDKLAETIGNYEMAVTPRSLFATDGTLLIPSDKSSFMKEIEKYPLPARGDQQDTDISDGQVSTTEPARDQALSTDQDVDKKCQRCWNS